MHLLQIFFFFFVTHAGAGALKEQLTGRDPLAGAIGAVVAETAAEALHKEGKDPATTAAQARIIGDTVAFLAGRDVASADSAGATAVENNYRGHLELHLMRQNIVNDKSLSDEEKQQRLAEVTDYGMQLYQAEGKGAALGFASSAFPTITAGYFSSQSAAHWAGTYAGGGIEAVKQEFKDHPILSTLDIATTGMLGTGFAKNLTKSASQMVEITQNAYKHHKVIGQLKSNVKQGRDFEVTKSNILRNNMPVFETQITLETGGVRTRIDGMGITAEGKMKLFEFKSSLTAPLTKNQKIAYPSLLQNGGVVIGKGKGSFIGGTEIPKGISVEVIRPRK